MYARNIIVGKMQYELGDHSFVRCSETGLEADIEFKTKGWIGGNYNVVGGYIKDTKAGKNLYELSGLWSGEMTIKDLSVNVPQCESSLTECLTMSTDRQERSAFRCDTRARLLSSNPTTRGARRTGVTKTLGEDYCSH